MVISRVKASGVKQRCFLSSKLVLEEWSHFQEFLAMVNNCIIWLYDCFFFYSCIIWLIVFSQWLTPGDLQQPHSYNICYDGWSSKGTTFLRVGVGRGSEGQQGSNSELRVLPVAVLRRKPTDERFTYRSFRQRFNGNLLMTNDELIH